MIYDKINNMLIVDAIIMGTIASGGSVGSLPPQLSPPHQKSGYFSAAYGSDTQFGQFVIKTDGTLWLYGSIGDLVNPIIKCIIKLR